LTAHLNEHRIGTRLLFAGNILKQPNFTQYKPEHRVSGTLSATDDAMMNAFWIGCYPGLDLERLTYVADTIVEFCKCVEQTIHTN
jgi:CDP-6-deoxy-D-xylo-4-hexulose-3-dehydrase